LIFNFKKYFSIIFILFTSLFFLIFLFFLTFPDGDTNTDIKPPDVEVKKVNIKMAFVGDIMLDRGVKSSVGKNFAGDYKQLFFNVSDQLRNYDILVANLEGPISNQGTDIGGIYSFRFEPRVVPVLKEIGFDVLSLANNHILNWDYPALVDTCELLTEEEIIYIGAGLTGEEAYSGKIIEKEGVKTSFLSFSEFTAGETFASSSKPGIAIISEKNVQTSISQAKLEADLVFVSFHFGEEYEKEPNLYQKKYAKLAIDSGADLIIGHHTHVIGKLDQYKNTYIIYSLGNFIFDQYFSPETMRGGLLEVEINSEYKKIEKVNLKMVQLNKMFQIESIE